jgi:hypothetical protein
MPPRFFRPWSAVVIDDDDDDDDDDVDGAVGRCSSIGGRGIIGSDPGR